MLYLEAAIESPGRQGGGHSELQGAPGQGPVQTVVKCIIQWLTQVRENLGICLTIFGIVMVAVIVTTIKIFLFDKETYPSLFYTPEELEAMKNRTVNNSVRCIYSCPALETTDDVWHFNFTISERRSQQHYFWNMKKSWTSTFNQRDKTKIQQKIFYVAFHSLI